MPLDWRSRAFVALAVMGIADAVYHAYDELTFTFGSCQISKILSCGAVFGSGHDTFPPAGSIPFLPKGIEFWVYGVVWFPLVLVVGLRTITTYGSPMRSPLVPFLMIGNIFTLYPWDIEIRVLGGVYCPVCVTLYLTNYLLTIVAFMSTSGEAQANGER